MLLNKKATKAYILKRVKTHRPGWDCTRVSPKVLLLLDARIKNWLDRGVHQHPSRGKTFSEII